MFRILLTVLFVTQLSSGFHIHHKSLYIQRKLDIKASTEIFESIRQPIESYVGIWVPMFQTMTLPDYLVHWGHGISYESSSLRT
jgi:hypothetical protein